MAVFGLPALSGSESSMTQKPRQGHQGIIMQESLRGILWQSTEKRIRVTRLLDLTCLDFSITISLRLSNFMTAYFHAIYASLYLSLSRLSFPFTAIFYHMPPSAAVIRAATRYRWAVSSPWSSHGSRFLSWCSAWTIAAFGIVTGVFSDVS